MARTNKGLSWRVKLAVLLALFALVPLLMASYAALQEQDRLVRRQTIASVEALVRAKAEAINQFADFRRRDAERMATLLSPVLASLVEAKSRTPTQEDPPAEQLPELRDAGEPNSGEPRQPTPPDPPQPPPSEDAGEPTGTSDGDEASGSSDGGGRRPKGRRRGADASERGAGAAKDGGAALESEDPDEGEDPDSAVTAAIAPNHPAPPPTIAPATVAVPARPSPALVDEFHRNLRQTLELIAWDREEFEELLVIDREGRVIASTFQQHEGHAAKSLRYFDQGLNSTFLEPVFLSPITGELTMVIATPIQGSDLDPIGVLAARLNLKRFFRLLNDTTGLGQTGETVAGRFDNEEAVIVLTAPTRRDPNAALQRKIPVGAPESRAIQEAARGQTGSGLTIDYDGVPVLAAWDHVPSLDWGLVVKVDEAEALGSVQEARRAAMVGGAVLLVIAVVSAIFISKLFVRPLQSLREAADRISRGDFDVAIDIRSNDEIGQLAESFERMIAAIKYFQHSRLEDSQELDAELAEPSSDDADPSSPA